MHLLYEESITEVESSYHATNNTLVCCSVSLTRLVKIDQFFESLRDVGRPLLSGSRLRIYTGNRGLAEE
jgi:hypothetical protein